MKQKQLLVQLPEHVCTMCRKTVLFCSYGANTENFCQEIVLKPRGKVAYRWCEKHAQHGKEFHALDR